MNILELKKFRSSQNISREKLAIELGITLEALNTWEYRNKKIPSDKIDRVKYVFNMYNYTYENQEGSIKYIENEGGKIEVSKFVNIFLDNQEKVEADPRFIVYITTKQQEAVIRYQEELIFKAKNFKG